MIEINNLTFSYQKNQNLFNNLSLSLELGNIYGLLGKNGAGKTTLLRLLTGMLYPEEGECLIDGIDAAQRTPEILQEIYVVPEEYDIEPVSINTFCKIYSPFYPKFSYNDFEKFAQELEIDTDKKLHKMSYGQKKKFLISFGLATNASYIIMDEPTNGLDIPSKSQFRKIIASSVNEERCFIISTHQVRDLENLIDPIVIIENGEITFKQTIENISKLLSFEEIKNQDENDVIFAEGIEGRKKGVVINKNSKQTQVDIELLFNAVILKKEIMKSIFKS